MTVDDKFLQAMGFEGLEDAEKNAALDDILYVLNMRVGDRIADTLSEEQAAEFEQFGKKADADKIAAWLDKNVPNRAQIIEEEAEKMRGEALAAVGHKVAQT